MKAHSTIPRSFAILSGVAVLVLFSVVAADLHFGYRLTVLFVAVGIGAVEVLSLVKTDSVRNP
jgi:hypothetical protein